MKQKVQKRFQIACMWILFTYANVSFCQLPNTNVDFKSSPAKRNESISNSCQIYDSNGHLVSKSIIGGYNIHDTAINLDSLNHCLTLEIQSALHKTLILSPFRDAFITSLYVALKEDKQMERIFIFANNHGQLKLIYQRNKSENDNFFMNFLKNLELKTSHSALKTYDLLTIPISFSLNKEDSLVKIGCLNGFIHTQIPVNSVLKGQNTSLSTTQTFYTTKERIQLRLSNPFKYSFRSCNGMLDCKIEKFDIKSRKWEQCVTITNHEDCNNSLSEDYINDSIKNFSFIPQSSGLYRAVVNTASKVMLAQPEITYQNLILYTEPFYIDDFISITKKDSLLSIDTISKREILTYWRHGKKQHKGNYYVANHPVIKSIDTLPYLNDLLMKLHVTRKENLRIYPVPSEKDPYLYHQSIDADLVYDPFNNIQEYPQYFSIIGNLILINNTPAILKNEIEVTLSRKTKKNPKQLQKFISENNLTIVACTLPIVKTKIKGNTQTAIDSKRVLILNGTEQKIILKVNTNNPEEIMKITRKIKEQQLFKRINNKIEYFSYPI